MIIEMRTYKIKSGKRAEFLRIFESKARPEHERIGMKILGPFLSVEDADTFFWIRAFPDLKSRTQMRDEFYEGKLWKEELEHKLMPMIEKYDVVVVKARRGPRFVAVNTAPRLSGLWPARSRLDEGWLRPTNSLAKEASPCWLKL